MASFGLLALDLATVTGFSLERSDRAPFIGSVRLTGGTHPGRKVADFYDWLSSFIQVNHPERILYEAPFMSSGMTDKDGRAIGNAATMEWLIEVAGMTKFIGYRFSLPVSKLASNSARKLFCGSGHAKKPDVMAECQRRGWEPKNFDESDAACLMDAGISLYFPGRYRRIYPGTRAA